MRIVWKDSNPVSRKTMNYRGYKADGYGEGWIIDVPGDDNIYRTHKCALNAIDKHLGGTGKKGGAKRTELGINVIGKKDKIS